MILYINRIPEITLLVDNDINLKCLGHITDELLLAAFYTDNDNKSAT